MLTTKAAAFTEAIAAIPAKESITFSLSPGALRKRTKSGSDISFHGMTPKESLSLVSTKPRPRPLWSEVIILSGQGLRSTRTKDLFSEIKGIEWLSVREGAKVDDSFSYCLFNPEQPDL